MSQENMKNDATLEENLPEILQVRRNKLALLKENNQDPFKIEKYDVKNYTSDIIKNIDEFEGKEVSVAGRIMSKRDIGQANFIDIKDSKGKIQSYVREDEIGKELFESFKTWDIGDIIGIKGSIFLTRRGEISIRAKEITLLSKSLQPLPEKWHGLTDTDTRYRQRYVDLIVNEEVKDTFYKRSKIITETRKFLENKGYIEVETPILQHDISGASAKPFETHYNAIHSDMVLRIAPELYLKRLIVGGFDKVFEIGRNFRNEGVSTRHNPEFTMLELYQAYSDYHDIMDLTEEIFGYLCNKINGTGKISYQGIDIDFDEPFERLSMKDAVKKYADIDFDEIKTDEEAKKLADKYEIKYEKHHKKGNILELLFDELCEDKIVQPTFIMNHPVETSPLAKMMPEDNAYTQRFEIFITGREFGNAYSEINDPIDQLERFENQQALRLAGDEEATGIDHDFINALEYGMPPTGGLGIGMDRLVMLLTDTPTIKDVLLFPAMKQFKD